MKIHSETLLQHFAVDHSFWTLWSRSSFSGKCFHMYCLLFSISLISFSLGTRINYKHLNNNGTVYHNHTYCKNYCLVQFIYKFFLYLLLPKSGVVVHYCSLQGKKSPLHSFGMRYQGVCFTYVHKDKHFSGQWWGVKIETDLFHLGWIHHSNFTLQGVLAVAFLSVIHCFGILLHTPVILQLYLPMCECLSETYLI
jgi:hypothetical protein